MDERMRGYNNSLQVMNLQAIIFRWWCLLEAIGRTDKSTDAMAMEAIVDLVLAIL